jgi:hypothetical protein
MKRLAIASFLALAAVFVFNDPAVAQSLPDNMSSIALETNEQRISLNKNGMLVLGGWAVANIASGTAGYFMADDERWKFFHQMNAGWNIVNLALATFGYIGQAGQDPANFTWLETIGEAEYMQKLLLFNAGLDVGYMAFGGYLWEKGRNDGSDRLVGYGQSLILQGAFLMAFDLTLFYLNHRLVDDFKMQIAPSADGVSAMLTWTF